MKYRKKSEIIEAVKWDGNIETVQNNKWLEDAIKEDKAMLCMDDMYDKEPTLLVQVIAGKNMKIVKIGDYVIKNSRGEKYIIHGAEAKGFEEEFESIQEAKVNNSFIVDLELNTKEFKEELNVIEENLKYTLGLIDKLSDKNAFKVITKDEFITNSIGINSKEEIEERWEELTRGYNFALYKEFDGKYYSVLYLNDLLGR